MAILKNVLLQCVLFQILLMGGLWTFMMEEAVAQVQPYRSVGSWGELPDYREWGAVSWVYPDKEGNIWVIDRCGRNTCLGSTMDPILKFDSEGNLLKSFGGGIFAWPHSLYIDHEGYVWVTDASGHWIDEAKHYLKSDPQKGHAVYKFSKEGKLLMTLGEPGVSGDGPRHFTNPADIVVAKNGDIFIADGHQSGGNNRIVKFNSKGRYINEWGKKGTAIGEFIEPHSIAMDSQGRIFVADRGNNRIQVFDQQGKFLEKWTQFGRPSGIFINRNDVMVVADSESNGEINPGWKRGIRIGSAKDGWVHYFIPDPEPHPEKKGTSGAEYAIIDEHNNVFGAEVGPRVLRKYIRLWPVLKN